MIDTLFVLSLLCALVTQPPAGVEQFQAGAAISNITPDVGSEIIGGFVPFPSQHVHDELHARFLVLDDGKTRLALVVCDLPGIDRLVSEETRKLIAEWHGIPRKSVLISATHTRSDTMSDSDYYSFPFKKGRDSHERRSPAITHYP